MRLALALLACSLALPTTAVAQTPEQLFQAGRLDDARAAFQARLAANRNDADAMYYLGRIAAAQEKPGEAASWFEKAIDRDGRKAEYHYWLGSALGEQASTASKLKQPFLARRIKASFERAVQLDSMMVGPRLGLVDFYSIAPGVMGGSMEKAREQADALLRLNPMRGHLAYARLANRAKDVAGEERALRDAVDAAPDSLAAHLNLGAFYRRHGRWEPAFATYDRLIAAIPSEPVGHALWGITAGQSGTNLERGERELDLYLASAPANASPITLSAVHFRLGQIYERTGRVEPAKRAYDEAVRLNARNAEARQARAALT